MMINDPLSDMIARIKNAATRKRSSVLTPASRLRQRVLDVLLRTGPYGDRFRGENGGLTLATLERTPEGIDHGPLLSQVPEILETASGKIELAPELLMQALGAAPARAV